MSAGEVLINRDLENDILYVVRQKVDLTRVMNYHVTADIILRRDPQTNTIVGLTIDDFSKVLPHLSGLDEYHLMEKFDAILEFLNAPDLASSIA
jgi:hypothetical protein